MKISRTSLLQDSSRRTVRSGPASRRLVEGPQPPTTSTANLHGCLAILPHRGVRRDSARFTRTVRPASARALHRVVCGCGTVSVGAACPQHCSPHEHLALPAVPWCLEVGVSLGASFALGTLARPPPPFLSPPFLSLSVAGGRPRPPLLHAHAHTHTHTCSLSHTHTCSHTGAFTARAFPPTTALLPTHHAGPRHRAPSDRADPATACTPP